jgi:hypothetical protein
MELKPFAAWGGETNRHPYHPLTFCTRTGAGEGIQAPWQAAHCVSNEPQGHGSPAGVLFIDDVLMDRSLLALPEMCLPILSLLAACGVLATTA